MLEYNEQYQALLNKRDNLSRAIHNMRMKARRINSRSKKWYEEKKKEEEEETQPKKLSESKEIINVDIDLIARLRAEGKHDEATTLIEAHQEAMKKNWKVMRKEAAYTNNRVFRHKRKAKGICLCGREEVREGKRSCQICADKWRLQRCSQKSNTIK